MRTNASRTLFRPFVGFFDLEPRVPDELPAKVDARLDEDTALIPRLILVLRKLARIRQAHAAASWLLGGAAVTWSFAARAQQRERMRRVGVLTPFAADDTDGHARLTAFAQALQQAGWTLGQNLRLDYRWGDGKPDTMRKHAANLAELAPDVILANSSGAVLPLLEVTRTVPIVFAAVADPVGAGYVESLARPGGNATGFTGLEYSFASKWLELIKEISPRVTRLAVLRDSAIAAGPGQFGVLQAFAPSLGLELRPVDFARGR